MIIDSQMNNKWEILPHAGKIASKLLSSTASDHLSNIASEPLSNIVSENLSNIASELISNMPVNNSLT